MSASVRPASFRQQRIARAGKPAAYFTRLKRSSSTAATSRPSQTTAAEAFPWYALIPRIFMARTDSVPHALDSRPEVTPAPFIQYIERPRPRPGSFAFQKCPPYAVDSFFAQMRRESGSRFGETGFQFSPQRSSQPFFPRQRERALGLRDDLSRQKLSQRFDQQCLLHAGPLTRGIRQRGHKFDQ